MKTLENNSTAVIFVVVVVVALIGLVLDSGATGMAPRGAKISKGSSGGTSARTYQPPAGSSGGTTARDAQTATGTQGGATTRDAQTTTSGSSQQTPPPTEIQSFSLPKVGVPTDLKASGFGKQKEGQQPSEGFGGGKKIVVEKKKGGGKCGCSGSGDIFMKCVGKDIIPWSGTCPPVQTVTPKINQPCDTPADCKDTCRAAVEWEIAKVASATNCAQKGSSNGKENPDPAWRGPYNLDKHCWNYKTNLITLNHPCVIDAAKGS